VHSAVSASRSFRTHGSAGFGGMTLSSLPPQAAKVKTTKEPTESLSARFNGRSLA